LILHLHQRPVLLNLVGKFAIVRLDDLAGLAVSDNLGNDSVLDGRALFVKRDKTSVVVMKL